MNIKQPFCLCKDIESVGFCNDCLVLLLVAVVVDHCDVEMVRLEMGTFWSQLFEWDGLGFDFNNISNLRRDL